MPTQTYRKKLIEVDLPLDAINRESAREKTGSSKKGHPSTMHRWWARRPLVACRVIAFASVVDDPSSLEDEFPNVLDQERERQRLHEIVTQLANVEGGKTEPVIKAAQIEMAKSIARHSADKPLSNADNIRKLLETAGPTVYDPFCGGGSIPLEAQRLGLNTISADLNPVAVLISKALVELPVPFSGDPPVHAKSDAMQTSWHSSSGLAEDIRYFGEQLRSRVKDQIGNLYPNVTIRRQHDQPVYTWIWFRTIKCPNPACRIDMPLTKSFQLSSKPGNHHWVKPEIDRVGGQVVYRITEDETGVPRSGTIGRTGATCISCSTSIKIATIRKMGISNAIDDKVVAAAVIVGKNRYFVEPDQDQINAIEAASPKWVPIGTLPKKALSIRPQLYGFTNWSDLFTKRQLVFLTTMVDQIKSFIEGDGNYSDIAHDKRRAIGTYLALALGRTTDYCSSFNYWYPQTCQTDKIFGRQGIAMVWNYGEINPFAGGPRDWRSHVEWVTNVVEQLPVGNPLGHVSQSDASSGITIGTDHIVITDPPYYDNIHFSDSSDFFYVWQRSMLRSVYPELYTSILTPKNDEIVANRFIHDDADAHFESRLKGALVKLRSNCSTEYPSSIMYAYKQQQVDSEGTVATGWDTMLSALNEAGFMVAATWPMRTERSVRQNAIGTNALATSVTIVVRPRPEDAPICTRQAFFDELESELTVALDRLTRGGHIAPADLPQAAIGPGMEIFTKYNRVETISGEAVTVRQALQQINRVVGTYFDREEGELDAETRFCVDWLKTHGHETGPYGDAENIVRAKNISFSDVANIHRLVNAERGIVQLIPTSGYHPDRTPPMTDMTAWEGCMRMAYHLDTSNDDGHGVTGCGEVGRRMAGNLDSVERLAHILYNHYDKLNQPRNAYIYNRLVSEWQYILDASQAPERPRLI